MLNKDMTKSKIKSEGYNIYLTLHFRHGTLYFAPGFGLSAFQLDT